MFYQLFKSFSFFNKNAVACPRYIYAPLFFFSILLSFSTVTHADIGSVKYVDVGLKDTDWKGHIECSGVRNFEENLLIQVRDNKVTINNKQHNIMIGKYLTLTGGEIVKTSYTNENLIALKFYVSDNHINDIPSERMGRRRDSERYFGFSIMGKHASIDNNRNSGNIDIYNYIKCHISAYNIPTVKEAKIRQSAVDPVKDLIVEPGIQEIPQSLSDSIYPYLRIISDKNRRAYITDADYGKLPNVVKEAAVAGDVNAQKLFAYLNLHGLHLVYSGTDFPPDFRQNHDEAIRWYVKAAEHGGDINAAYTLGSLFHEGRVVVQNYKKAIKWYALAAKNGHKDAQLQLGNFYSSGKSVPQSFVEARKWYMRSASQGHAEAQFKLGKMFENDGAWKNNRLAIKWYLKAAAQIHPHAKFRLARMFEEGKGTPPVKSIANTLDNKSPFVESKFKSGMHDLEYFRRKGEFGGRSDDFRNALNKLKFAAQLYHPDAQYNLGLLYSRRDFPIGISESPSEFKAVEWLKRAAAQGHSKAKKQLETTFNDPTPLYATPSSIFQKGLRAYYDMDYETAKYVWEPIANDGDKDAQFMLGLMLLHRGGYIYPYRHNPVTDFETILRVGDNWKAEFLICSAAKQGHTYAQYYCGILGESDRVQGLKWLALASMRGLAEEIRHFNHLKFTRSMTDDEMKAARSLALKWLHENPKVSILSFNEAIFQERYTQ